MAKKHKGGKHEKARKTASASRAPVSRAPAKAAKRIRPARPRSAEPELVVILEPELEPEGRGFHTVEEVLVEDVILEDAIVEDVIVEEVIVEPAPSSPFRESHRSAPYRFELMPSYDWETDFAFQCAEEQVALAMLEAEQAVAFCQGYDDVDPYPFLEASPGPASHAARMLPSFASQPRSIRSMERDAEEEPFAFDHI